MILRGAALILFAQLKQEQRRRPSPPRLNNEPAQSEAAPSRSAFLDNRAAQLRTLLTLLFFLFSSSTIGIHHNISHTPCGTQNSQTMAASSPQGAGDQGVVDWANLKKLLALQESQQQNLMQPEQLTPAQLRIITELNRTTSVALEMLSPTMSPEEPNLGGKDWVSLLQRRFAPLPVSLLLARVSFLGADIKSHSTGYRDAHADGSHISYRDETRDLKKWCTFTKLSEAGDLVFPQDAFPFSRKKEYVDSKSSPSLSLAHHVPFFDYLKRLLNLDVKYPIAYLLLTRCSPSGLHAARSNMLPTKP